MIPKIIDTGYITVIRICIWSSVFFKHSVYCIMMLHVLSTK